MKEKEFLKKLGQKIRDLRTKKSWTLCDLAAINKHAVPGDGGKVLIAGEFCRINTALLMSRPLKTDGDGAFVHTLALSPCLPHRRFAGDSPY